MVPPKFTIVQGVAKVFGIIGKYPFSIFLILLVLFTIFTIVFNKKIKSRAPKIIAILSWIIVALLMFIKYAASLKFLRMTLKSGTFSSMYFPNVITFIIMLFISAFIFFRAIYKKEKSMVVRIVNAVCFGLIGVNFLLILREVFKNHITIYDPLTIYKYETLQAIIQTSTFVFVLWMIILGIYYLAKIVTKKLDTMSEKNKKVTK